MKYYRLAIGEFQGYVPCELWDRFVEIQEEVRNAGLPGAVDLEGEVIIMLKAQAGALSCLLESTKDTMEERPPSEREKMEEEVRKAAKSSISLRVFGQHLRHRVNSDCEERYRDVYLSLRSCLFLDTGGIPPRIDEAWAREDGFHALLAQDIEWLMWLEQGAPCHKCGFHTNEDCGQDPCSKGCPHLPERN